MNRAQHRQFSKYSIHEKIGNPIYPIVIKYKPTDLTTTIGHYSVLNLPCHSWLISPFTTLRLHVEINLFSKTDFIYISQQIWENVYPELVQRGVVLSEGWYSRAWMNFVRLSQLQFATCVEWLPLNAVRNVKIAWVSNHALWT